jgi:hypothetical protein
MKDEIRHLNLKEGMPTVDQARRVFADALRSARRDGVSAMILIHGYGSQGVGGKIRIGIQSSLRQRQKEGLIRAFVPGETWAYGDPTSEWMIEQCPELDYDPDLGSGNPGMSVVLI